MQAEPNPLHDVYECLKKKTPILYKPLLKSKNKKIVEHLKRYLFTGTEIKTLENFQQFLGQKVWFQGRKNCLRNAIQKTNKSKTPNNNNQKHIIKQIPQQQNLSNVDIVFKKPVPTKQELQQIIKQATLKPNNFKVLTSFLKDRLYSQKQKFEKDSIEKLFIVILKQFKDEEQKLDFLVFSMAYLPSWYFPILYKLVISQLKKNPNLKFKHNQEFLQFLIMFE